MRIGLLVVLVVFAMLVGCRQEDVRSLAIEVPSLTPAAVNSVRAALVRYGGVRGNSVRFDFDRHIVWLEYDSMQVAATNLRMALTERGMEVRFPENKNGRNR